MADLSGQTLGKYRLVERLGRGGMADVYRAYQPSLERDVAVKVMHGYLAEDVEFVSRFRREAQAVAALRHPHIVQIYDFDVEGDVYYMVMEYIHGPTLKERLERLHAAGVRMGWDELRRLFRALCDALDEAHGQGCIHRDIKPANIMFDGERLVLTDFGIAAIVGGTRFTATGAVVGTPAYMSPEQGQGEAGGVRSDVYSLGVILYEIVTGRLPYDADTPLAIILKHLNEPLPLPSRIGADVPPAVERVILKALSKSPDDRYASAGALADALEAAVAALETASPLPRPAATRIIPRAPETVRVKRRLPWTWIGGALLLIVLVVAALLFLPRLLRRADPAVAQAHLEAGRLAFEVDDPQLAVDEFSAAIDAGLSSAEAYYLRAQAYHRIGEPTAAVDDLSRAVELDPQMAAAYVLRGQVCLYEQGEWQEALSDFSTALELDPTLVDAYIGRAQAYFWYTDEYERATADVERAVELAPERADGWAMRGESAFWTADYQRALPDLQRAVELDPELTWVWELLGACHYMLGDYEAAIAAYEQGVTVDPSDMALYFHRALARMALGDWAAAQEDLERVLLLEPGDGPAHYALGRLYVQTDRFEQAVVEFTAALEAEDYLWFYAGEDENATLERARAYMEWGRPEEALRDLDDMLAEQPDWYLPRFYRGQVYRQLGQIERAAEDFRLAWENAPDDEWRHRAEQELQGLSTE